MSTGQALDIKMLEEEGLWLLWSTGYRPRSTKRLLREHHSLVGQISYRALPFLRTQTHDHISVSSRTCPSKYVAMPNKIQLSHK